MLSRRTNEYQGWVEAYARNHEIPIEWGGKGVRKEDYVLPALRRMERKNAYGVYFLFKSMEQGRTFRITVPEYPTKDPNYRILANQQSRLTHYYFYIRDEVLGPIIVRMASFFLFHATYWLNGHAAELVATAQQAGGDLAKAAKAAGLQVKTSDEFTRDASVEGIGPASYFQEGFAKPDGTVFGPVATADSTVVAKVIQHVPADMSKLAEQRAAIRDELKTQKARDRALLFENGLKEDILKRGKLKIREDVVMRIINNYRAS